MKSAEEVGQILARAGPAEKVAFFGALLVRESGLDPDELIVVGSSAIEIYTRGGIASGDLDLIGPRDQIVRTLKAWEFEPSDRRMWIRKDWGLFVHVRKELDGYNGSREGTRFISTPYGGVRVEGIEDAMVRRLISARHWQAKGDFAHALAVAESAPDDIDWDYAEQYAKQELVADLLSELRKRLGP